MCRESIPNSLVKHTLQVALRQSRTFQVLVCADLLGHRQGLLVGHRLHLPLAESFGGCAVVSQIELGADQDDRDVGGMVFNLGEPLRSVSSD